MIPDPRSVLGHLHGGRVLDVATGAGGFARFLDDGLADYDEIVGIDTDLPKMAAFADAMADRPRIGFEVRDAASTDYPDASFDTVAVANSLHHFSDPLAVLGEMFRVLRDGGAFIVFEMYRDGQEAPQLTHVQLHHWWAAVDTRRGIVHRETYTRGELLELIAPLGLVDLAVTDVANPEDDPLDPDSIVEIDEVIDRYLAWADGEPRLTATGRDLRHRLHEIGIRGATSLAIVGRKPAETTKAAA
jgi:SAM-dependent methyltransferase